jgi:hypothetical protein
MNMATERIAVPCNEKKKDSQKDGKRNRIKSEKK